MVEAFGGVLNLIIWLLLIVAGGYYAYRCLLQTKGFIDQYGFGKFQILTLLSGSGPWCLSGSTLFVLSAVVPLILTIVPTPVTFISVTAIPPTTSS